MPDFEPNEHMLTKYASKGTQKWEIFAWCVRDAMAKAGDFKVVDDLSIKDKLRYNEFMKMETDQCQINQQVYFAEDSKRD